MRDVKYVFSALERAGEISDMRFMWIGGGEGRNCAGSLTGESIA